MVYVIIVSANNGYPESCITDVVAVCDTKERAEACRKAVNDWLELCPYRTWDTKLDQWSIDNPPPVSGKRVLGFLGYRQHLVEAHAFDFWQQNETHNGGGI